MDNLAGKGKEIVEIYKSQPVLYHFLIAYLPLILSIGINIKVFICIVQKANSGNLVKTYVLV